MSWRSRHGSPAGVEPPRAAQGIASSVGATTPVSVRPGVHKTERLSVILGSVAPKTPIACGTALALPRGGGGPGPPPSPSPPPEVWNGEQALGGEASWIAVGQNAGGRLELFYVGNNAVFWNNLYHNFQWVASNDYDWHLSFVDGPDLARSIAWGQNADGRLELFYAGDNHHLYHNWQNVPQ
jgi:hypothetical protein